MILVIHFWMTHQNCWLWTHENVIDESVIKTVRTVESLQYNQYYESVIQKCERSIHGTISKNNLPLFKRPKAKSKQTKAVAMLKDALHFSLDCILWQETENVICIPSLSMKISPFLLPYLSMVTSLDYSSSSQPSLSRTCKM